MTTPIDTTALTHDESYCPHDGESSQCREVCVCGHSCNEHIGYGFGSCDGGSCDCPGFTTPKEKP